MAAARDTDANGGLQAFIGLHWTRPLVAEFLEPTVDSVTSTQKTKSGTWGGGGRDVDFRAEKGGEAPRRQAR